MSNTKVVSDYYLHGSLLKAIQAAITKLGKTVDSVTIDDLAAVDEFHIGGRRTTGTFLEQLNFSEQDHILDVGCGLGGAARFVADKYNNHVRRRKLSYDPGSNRYGYCVGKLRDCTRPVVSRRP